MKVIYRQLESIYSTKPDSPCSFELLLDEGSEYYCQLVLAQGEDNVTYTFKGNVSIDMTDSVISLSIRYMFFKPIFEALLAGALIIRYHGYQIIPDLKSMTLSDHRDHGKDYIFNCVKFKAVFDFQQ